jgi:hypothetical protein
MKKIKRMEIKLKKIIYHKFDSMIKLKTNKTLTKELKKKNSKSKD